uniref:Uncharacterized protein n=1 Tax=Cyprinus carpio carpio TaxID=630221 RepID=A0A9J7Y2A6_CYPCA
MCLQLQVPGNHHLGGPVLDQKHLQPGQEGSPTPLLPQDTEEEPAVFSILVNFYRCAIESILTSCITVWYGNCSVADRKALHKVVKTTQRITGTPLPAIEDIQRKCCLRRACSILKDSSHPDHRLFNLLPSGRRFRSLWTRTSRLRNSFFPTAVSLLNSAL